MKSKMLSALTATALVLLMAGLTASLADAQGAEPPAVKECAGISEGGEFAIKACEQGYKGGHVQLALVKVCLRGVGEVAAVENQLDCKFGYIAAAGGKKSFPAAGPKAVEACKAITEGGSPAACEQGYAGAVSGLKIYEACASLGSGAITTFESVGECEDGWFAGKGRTTCIPGSDVQNGQPGTTINADTEADKTCSEA